MTDMNINDSLQTGTDSLIKPDDRGRGNKDVYKGEFNRAYTKKITDEDLVRIYVRSRDQQAFNELLDRYCEKIYGTAIRILKDPDKAEDILQEVCLTLVEKLGAFRQESKFSTWLYRVTVNCCYMHLRNEKKFERDLSLNSNEPYDENGSLEGRIADKDWSRRPETLSLSNEAMGIIEKAVEELPEPYLVVFQLRDMEGLTNDEVSDVLQISVSAVKSRLHRARLFLRERLTDHFYGQ